MASQVKGGWLERVLLRFMQGVLTAKRNRMIYRHLPPGATRVADFGCGHYPNRHANVLVDSVGLDDVQRGGLRLTRGGDECTFHDLDLNAFPYPFEDGYFDYLICSHVLEHLEDPVRACAEFSRIAKSGYLEVPFASVDAFIRNNDVIHAWLCGLEQGTGRLLFTRRSSFLESFPPRPLCQALRFYLQFQNLTLTWDGEVQAAYCALRELPPN